MEAEVSIIIVNYKTPKLILSCLESIFQFNKDLKKEILVVDNNSKDNSKKIITHKYPTTIWISNPINYGVAAAFNIGVKHAKGKYVLILNSDTIFSDNAIEKSLLEYKKLQKKTKIAMLSIQALNPDKSKQKTTFSSFPELKDFIKRNSIYIKFFNYDKQISSPKISDTIKEPIK